MSHREDHRYGRHHAEPDAPESGALHHGGDEEFRPYDDDAPGGRTGWLAAMKVLLNSAEPEAARADGYSPTSMSESVGAYASVSSGTSPTGTSLV